MRGGWCTWARERDYQFRIHRTAHTHHTHNMHSFWLEENIYSSLRSKVYNKRNVYDKCWGPKKLFLPAFLISRFYKFIIWLMSACVLCAYIPAAAKSIISYSKYIWINLNVRWKSLQFQCLCVCVILYFMIKFLLFLLLLLYLLASEWMHSGPRVLANIWMCTRLYSFNHVRSR